MDYSLSLDMVGKYMKKAYLKSDIATEKHATHQTNDILFKSKETRLLMILTTINETLTINPSR